MITSMVLSGGPLAQSYDFMSPTSKIQLEHGFSQAISQRGSAMLGRDPYVDMVTSLPLTAVGATEAEAWTEYNKFCTFAQRIAAFPLAPDRYPIIFGYKTVAAATLMSTLCLSSADGNPRSPIVTQPSGGMLDDAAGMYRIRGFKISFKHKGRFVRATGESALSAVTNGVTNSPYNTREALGIFAADFETDSPLNISMFLPTAITDRPLDAHLLISNPHTYHPTDEFDVNARYQSFFIFPGRMLGTVDPTFTTVADTTANTFPHSGVGIALSRWQATDNTAKTTKATIASGTGIGTPKNFLLLASVRSDIAASTSTMTFSVEDDQALNTVRGKTVSLIGDNTAKLVNCGIFSVPEAWEANIGGPKIAVTHQNTSTVLSRVWIDELILVNLDVANLAYVRMGRMQTAGAFGEQMNYTVDQRYLTAAMPHVIGGIASGADVYPNAAWGNLHMSVKAKKVRVLFLAVGATGAAGGAGAPQWRWLRTSTYLVTLRANRAGLAPLGI